MNLTECISFLYVFLIPIFIKINLYMHQLASFIVSFLLSPFNWIIVLLIAAYFVRKQSWKRTSIVLAICLFVLFGNQFLLDKFARSWQPAPVAVNRLPVYSCGIVAGGFASPAANGDGYFNGSADRFIQAVKLYMLGKINRILISGGNGKPGDKSFREAAWVKTQLLEFGVPDSVIFVEDRSDNTFDNAANSKKILDSLHLAPPYLLISSAWHLPRAVLIFKKSGLAVQPFPCNYTEGIGATGAGDFLPRPSVVMGWDRYLKEAVAWLWYKAIES
jgi:uncharacterized SAM-binding protein YcdF (DUF218 family)